MENPQSLPPAPVNDVVVTSVPVKKSMMPIIALVMLVLALVVGALIVGIFFGMKQSSTKMVETNSPQVANPTVAEGSTTICTMDAKVCPDGSSVGRSGPNCEFAECPVVITPSVDQETQNWRNVQHTSWSYKLPEELHFITCENGINDLIGQKPDIEKDSEEECNFDLVPLISFVKYGSGSAFEIPSNTVPGKAGEFYTYISNKNEITIDGLSGFIQQEQVVGGQGEGTYLSAYLLQSGSIYRFQLNDLSQEKVFKQILSTVQIK